VQKKGLYFSLRKEGLSLREKETRKKGGVAAAGAGEKEREGPDLSPRKKKKFSINQRKEQVEGEENLRPKRICTLNPYQEKKKRGPSPSQKRRITN